MVVSDDFSVESNVLIRQSNLPDKKKCIAKYLGSLEYDMALQLQEMLQQKRLQNAIPDVLLLLEHPAVYTIGRFSTDEDILVPRSELEKEDIAVITTSRGGKITYHGPGQVVVYPILNLKENRIGVREYVWKLEEVVIRLLKDFDIRGERNPVHAGVWANDRKICSIGVHISHYITTHGFAMNVNTDLRYFEYIRPCGLTGREMTSMSQQLGHPLEIGNVIEHILNRFSSVFDMECVQGDIV